MFPISPTVFTSLLHAFTPHFSKLFKVKLRFSVVRTPQNFAEPATGASVVVQEFSETTGALGVGLRGRNAFPVLFFGFFVLVFWSFHFFWFSRLSRV